ncbi:MAG: alkaline phosphatase family protein [Candidatus Hodarchaeota archaeon]
MDATPRVLLIGIDGGTFRVIRPGISSGKLPAFQQIIETGISGVLRSTIPPATIPAFPTLMTGKNCGKHGIFDFMGKKDSKTILMDSTQITGKTLWRILSDFGKKCIVVNVPLTFPPENIDGIIISGMLTPIGRDFAHPKQLMEELDNLTGGYPVQFDSSIADTNPSQFLPKLHELLTKRHTAIRYLMQKGEWDLFVALFRATDIVAHHRWADQKGVLSIYEHVDRILGELLLEYPNTHLFIFSDHGFAPYKKDFHINLYLNQLGLLTIQQKHRKEKRLQETTKIKPIQAERFASVLARMGIYRSRLRNIIPPPLWNKLRKLAGPSFRRYISPSHLEVDEKRSKAYFSPTFTAETQSITINASTSEEYEELVNKLKKAFSDLKDPESGNSVVNAVFHRRDIYTGPFVDNAPDLILLLSEDYKATKTLSGKNILERLSQIKGTHERSGVFMAKGGWIKAGHSISEIDLQDITPTILHLFDLPIPDDVDGEVKEEIFLADSDPAKRKPKFYTSKDEKRRQVQLSKQEEEEIKDRLRSLGYID